MAANNTAKKKPGAGRRQGGQPGNKNAYKHGFYASHFTKAEVTRMGKMADETDVLSELQLVRLILSRVVAKLAAGSLQNRGSELKDEALKGIDRVVSLSAAISSLVRTRHLVQGKSSDVETAILDALELARDELGLK